MLIEVLLLSVPIILDLKYDILRNLIVVICLQ